jgi:hypothetical protein
MEIAESEYYGVKEISPSDISFPEHTVRGGKFDRYLEKLTTALQDYLVDFTPPVEDKTIKVTKTGFDTYSLGTLVREFEWSSKDPRNALSALFKRQLSSEVTPDPIHLAGFQDMSDRFLKHFFSKFKGIERKLSFTEWIDSKTEWTHEKRKKYF